MKTKLLACFVAAGALAIAVQATAQPFLFVDVNGSNASPPMAGPTEAGFEGWDAFEGLFLDPSVDWANSGATGLTKVFSTTEGNITAHMTGVGSSLGARDRGAGGQLTCCLRPVQQDFAFAQRDTTLSPPVGRNYIKLELSGLTPNETYRFTGFAREAAFQDARLLDPDDPTQSFQAWTDLAALGGIDGPAAWLDSNGLGPAGYDPAVGGVNNPIPTLRRSQTAGPDSLSDANPFFHSATFDTTADGGGVVTLYTWADPNGYASDTQGATLLNGFQLAPIPEPSAGILLGIAIACFAKVRRRN